MMKPEVAHGNEKNIRQRVKREAGAAGQGAWRCDQPGSPRFGSARERVAQMGGELAVDPQHAFPGQGQMKPEQAEIARPKKENTKLRMERDIPKKPRPISPRRRCEVRLRDEASRDLAGGDGMRGARCPS